MFDIVLSELSAILGGVATALTVGWLSWTALKILRRPEFGPPVTLVALLLGFSDHFRSNEFLRMTCFFLVIASVLVWHEGRALRLSHPAKRADRNISEPH